MNYGCLPNTCAPILTKHRPEIHDCSIGVHPLSLTSHLRARRSELIIKHLKNFEDSGNVYCSQLNGGHTATGNSHQCLLDEEMKAQVRRVTIHMTASNVD